VTGSKVPSKLGHMLRRRWPSPDFPDTAWAGDALTGYRLAQFKESARVLDGPIQRWQPGGRLTQVVGRPRVCAAGLVAMAFVLAMLLAKGSSARWARRRRIGSGGAGAACRSPCTGDPHRPRGRCRLLRQPATPRRPSDRRRASLDRRGGRGPLGRREPRGVPRRDVEAKAVCRFAVPGRTRFGSHLARPGLRVGGLAWLRSIGGHLSRCSSSPAGWGHPASLW
jgi:hypothetical protein